MQVLGNLRRTLRYIIYNGIATSSMSTMTSSTIVVAYAMLLGADPMHIGLIGNINYISFFSYFIASFLINKGYSARNISVNFSFVARFFYLIIALLALFNGGSWVVLCLLLCLFMSSFIGSIAGGVFYPWMKSLLPENILASFFAERFRWITITSIVFYLLTAGFFYVFDYHISEYKIYAYSIIFFFAFLAGLYSVYTFTQLPNIKLPCSDDGSFWHKIIVISKRKSVILMSCFLGLINFSVCFITPFITVYILSVLKFSMPMVIILTILSNIAYAVSTKWIGHKVKQFGYYPTIIVGISGCVLCLLCLTCCLYFEMSLAVIFLLVLAHILLGLSKFIIDLGANNVQLIFVPEKDSSVYIAVINFIRAMFATIAGICSGYILASLQSVYNDVNTAWQTFWFIGMICFISVLISAVPIRRYIK